MTEAAADPLASAHVSGLRRALIGLAVAGLALGLAALALVTASDREDDSTSSIVLALTLGWGFAGAGIFAWWRRPDNRLGPLMALVGFTWFLGALTSADTAWAFTLGLLVGTLWLGALVHMLVAFPSGRVQPGLKRPAGGPRLVRHDRAAAPGGARDGEAERLP